MNTEVMLQTRQKMSEAKVCENVFFFWGGGLAKIYIYVIYIIIYIYTCIHM